MTYSEGDPGGNQTISHVLILVGFSSLGKLQILLFVVLLIIYLATLMGNLLIILVIKLTPFLHTPMYFFLVKLSVLDICFTTSVFPQLLLHLLVQEKTIHIVGCAVQMFVLCTLGFMECCLLAAMAYDRYVAICHPLHYTTIMNGWACAQMVGASWFISILVEVAVTIWIFSLPFCGSNRIHHFFCDIPPVMKIVCADTSQIQILGFIVTVLFIVSPFLLILLSYICIVFTILNLPSVEGRNKAFSTCSSHLMVVMFFYGSALITYLVPKSSSTTESDLMVSLVNICLIPLLNPIIYTLRNKEMTSSKSYLGGNQTTSHVLILVGFSSLSKMQILLFVVLLVICLVTLTGCLLSTLLIRLNPSLHTPMYFFLMNLSVVEFCYTNSVVPQLLLHLLVEEKTISIAGCAAQMFIFSRMGIMECYLLAAMAYDRYVVICHPLHYTTIMSGWV
ncbi:olfactory receptor 10A4-like [Carettochelys insculpta]|uniref:olfactory receptor 10A4-like n=1 Tax=Carettochelys insculpta TaxID=44489 RepID=UPI003EBB9D41